MTMSEGPCCAVKAMGCLLAQLHVLPLVTSQQMSEVLSSKLGAGKGRRLSYQPSAFDPEAVMLIAMPASCCAGRLCCC